MAPRRPSLLRRAACGAPSRPTTGALPVALVVLASLLAPPPATAAPPGGLVLVRTLPWGGGADGVTLQEAGRERPARGPAAIGVAADGALLVVDTLARRVLRVGAEGPPEVVFAAAETLEPVAAVALPDGRLAVLDAVGRRVAFAKDGAVGRQSRLPHGLHHLAGLTPLTDGRIALVTAYQESYPVPERADADTASWFAARLPGVPLPDGRLATVERTDSGGIVLRWLELPPVGSGWDLAETATLSLDPPARAARIVGGTRDGGIVLELDHDEPSAGDAARFGRRLLRVLPAGQGKGTASVTLPTEELLYVPSSGSAVGPDGSVAVLLPVAEGLRLLRWQPPAPRGAGPAPSGAPEGGVRPTGGGR